MSASDTPAVSVPVPVTDSPDRLLELIERCREAERILRDMAAVGPVSERPRMNGKAAGVALACSYIEEARRA